MHGLWRRILGGNGGLSKKRVTAHNEQIRDPETRMLYVSDHMSTCAHQLNPKYTIFPFYKMYSNNVSFQRATENYFINPSRTLIK